MLAATGGEAFPRPLWNQWSRRKTSLERVFALLNEVATHAPGAANAWLNAWLETRADGLPAWGGRAPWLASLPAGLACYGWLDLSGTGITALPDGLRVDGVLDLHGLPITSLPATLVVTGDLNLSGTRLSGLPKGFAAQGGLDLTHAPIRVLPEGLNVAHLLGLRGTRVVTLPRGLKVGVLDLQGCLDWDGEIPHDAQVHSVVTANHPAGMPRLSLSEWRALHPTGEGRS
jgi:hypothetical protein